MADSPSSPSSAAYFSGAIVSSNATTPSSRPVASMRQTKTTTCDWRTEQASSELGRSTLAKSASQRRVWTTFGPSTGLPATTKLVTLLPVRQLPRSNRLRWRRRQQRREVLQKGRRLRVVFPLLFPSSVVVEYARSRRDGIGSTLSGWPGRTKSMELTMRRRRRCWRDRTHKVGAEHRLFLSMCVVSPFLRLPASP